MQQQVGVGNLFESGAERRDQRVRQATMKPTVSESAACCRFGSFSSRVSGSSVTNNASEARPCHVSGD